MTVRDLEKFVKSGFLVSPTINVNALEKKSGYAGHAILIMDIDNKFITFHDPRLPPIENSKIRIKNFEKAWQSPGTANAVVVVFGIK